MRSIEYPYAMPSPAPSNCNHFIARTLAIYIFLFILLNYNQMHSYKFWKFSFTFSFHLVVCSLLSPSLIRTHSCASFSDDVAAVCKLQTAIRLCGIHLFLAAICWMCVCACEQKVGVKLISHGPYAIGSNTKICITPLTFRAIRVKNIRPWIYSRWTMAIGRLSL